MGSPCEEHQPKIFRPWDQDEPTDKQKSADKCEIRVPPVDWDGVWMGLQPLDDYWSCLAAELSGPQSKAKQRPKKFRCPHCDVAFSNNGQLRGHVRIHTGERPYKCEAEGCGKKFTRNEELTRHKRIHSGLRPFPCDSCGKSFGRKDHLKKHARTHLPPPPHHLPGHPHPFLLYPYLYGY